VESFLCQGNLRHERLIAPKRTFTYPLFMLYLDLGELESVFAGRWLWSTKRANVAWFRRADHYGDGRVPLDVAIRDLVEARSKVRPEGPIRLLTHLRYFGHCFNPVSFYYCFAKDGRALETIVAEVNNTPWNEQHLYVLSQPIADGASRGKEYSFKKAFHVSPFLGMDMDYGWRFGRPAERDGDRLWVHMENRQKGSSVFEATLTMTRRPIDGPELARALARRPAMTMQVVSSIYSQAFRLWLRRAPFFSHPTVETSRQP
jgi:DUF1365 family protein